MFLFQPVHKLNPNFFLALFFTTQYIVEQIEQSSKIENQLFLRKSFLPTFFADREHTSWATEKEKTSLVPRRCHRVFLLHWPFPNFFYLFLSFSRTAFVVAMAVCKSGGNPNNLVIFRFLLLNLSVFYLIKKFYTMKWPSLIAEHEKNILFLTKKKVW